MKDMFAGFDDLDALDITKSRERIIKAPIRWPGGKGRIAKEIIKILPYRDRYIEPFGGAGAVLLARHPSNLEVYNDRYGGIVAFFRCLRDPIKCEKMCDWIRLTVHSREDFLWCRDNWNQEIIDGNYLDDVSRACMWYYSMIYSFAGIGRNFGRSTSSGSVLAGQLINKIPHLREVHTRIRKVQIENMDWSTILLDYDSEDAVIYCDPPYLETSAKQMYDHILSTSDHRRLLDTIFASKGYVAISSYKNDLYESYPWDDRYTFQKQVTLKSKAYAVGHSREHLRDIEENTYKNTEVLYIKE